MRMILLLIPLVGCSCTFRSTAQERLRIDLDEQAGKTQPAVASGRGIGPSSVGSESKPSLKLTLLPLKRSSDGSILYEIDLVNISDRNIAVPISVDGAKLATTCPQNTVETATVSLVNKSDLKNLHMSGLFYGCDAVDRTSARLTPGEWISYSGKLAQTARLKDLRAEISLSTVKYSINEKFSTQLRNDYYFSGWQAVAQLFPVQ